MDQIVFSTAELVCNVMRGVGLERLAHDVGFEGPDFLGVQTVYCGAQPSSYRVGIIVWLIIIGAGLYALQTRSAKTDKPPE